MGQLGYNHGDLGWSELTTTDAASALEFYGALAGWTKLGEPVPGYHIFGKNGEALGGVSDQQCSDSEIKAPPHWMPYITVDDLTAAIAKVEELGGRVLMTPMPIPNDGGHIAIIQDPQGVATGLAQYKRP